MPFAQNHNTKIFYEISGDGPLLTICGGLGDSLRNWNLLIRKLEKQFRILFVENRGAGQSSRPTEPYTMVDMAADVKAVFEQEGITQTLFLGFSMGGRIAQQFTLDYPDCVEKLVLISTSATWHYRFPPKPHVRETLNQFQGTDEDFMKIYEILYAPAYRHRFSPEAFAKFRKGDPYPQTVLDFQLQLQAIESFDARERLSEIQVPTLIQAGEQDALTPVQNAQWLHSLLPNSKICTYPEAGHIVQIEAQKEFLEDLTGFLLN